MAPCKIPVKYSCEEIYDRMAKGLCIFCENLDTPGHHDLKHKALKILVTEGEDEPIMTDFHDKPIIEESMVQSDEFVTKTVMKPDVSSESMEGSTSVLQIVVAAGQKKVQNNSDTEENMTCSLGNNIEHMVGKQSQMADRIWEPGGFLAKPDREKLQAEAVLHRQEIYQACQSQKAHLVCEPGGSVGKKAPWNCLDKYHKHGVVLKLNAKTHETCLHNTLEVLSAEETQTWMVNEKMRFNVLPDLDLEAWVRLATYGFKYQKLMSLLVKESRRVWERGGLTATCALAIVKPRFDISFDDMAIQEMRKSCVLIVHIVTDTFEKLRKSWKFRFRTTTGKKWLQVLKELKVRTTSEVFESQSFTLCNNGNGMDKFEVELHVWFYEVKAMFWAGKNRGVMDLLSSSYVAVEEETYLGLEENKRPEDKREDQHKQNEVMKLTSSWHNRLWEPGGSPADVAQWNWTVSCHDPADTLELILKLQEAHLQRNTKGEVLELSCSQKFGVEKDVEATVGKWPEKRHRLLFYATMPVLITGSRYSIKRLTFTLSRFFNQNSATMRKMRWLHMIELVCSMMIKLDEKSSLKNLEKFRSLKKAASGINSLLNVLEPVMPSSRRLLVAGLRQCNFAGMNFYLKRKWRSLVHLCTQMELRTSIDSMITTKFCMILFVADD
ncbi:hypothetical protein Bca4012_065118 [Brassica carinata]|uniref:Uncharacterized protein n=1 Tax=Brassica carinata TaxID=52824 RepID=A0A8X8AWF6_BRACI|nr:hypothetical protein Bca52824_017562 [Brassica carinata]